MSKQEYFTYVEMKDNNNSFSLPHFKWTGSFGGLVLVHEPHV